MLTFEVFPNFIKMKISCSILLSIFIVGIFHAQYPGSIDNTFSTGGGANGLVRAIALQSNNKILIGGGFSTYHGITRNELARVNTNGSVDYTFNSGSGLAGGNDLAMSIALQTDGKIIVGGSFTSYMGTSIYNVLRLYPNGDIDSTFNIGGGTDKQVNSVAIQLDGKIIIGGYFNSYNGTLSKGLARLNNDGTIDSTFQVGAGTTRTGLYVGTHKIIIQPDNKIIIIGIFDAYDSIPRDYIARINPNGTLDLTFTTGNSLQGGNITAVGLQTDGKIVIGGPFTSIYGVENRGVARVNSNGSHDASFTSSYGIGFIDYPVVLELVIQENGKIIIVGDFPVYNGAVQTDIARLNENGSIDNTFDEGTGTDGQINTCILQQDGKVLIGGLFDSYNTTNTPFIARINGGEDYTGLNEFNTSTIKFYPNPSTNILAVSNITKETTITFYDSQARKVLVAFVTQDTLIDIRSLSDGVYSVFTENSSGILCDKILILK